MLRAHKQLVRTRIAAQLRTIPKVELDRQSRVVTNKLFDMDVWKKAKNVAVFVSMPTSEINTRVIEELLQPGSQRTCFLPKVHADRTGYVNTGAHNAENVMNMLQVHSLEELDAFPLHHKFKIPEPPNDGKRLNSFDIGLDLVLIPGMAFGKRGTRLGHGKGYYDRFIATIRHIAERNDPDEPKYPHLLALALNEQVYDFVPIEKTDEILDEILWAEQDKPLRIYDELVRDLNT